MTHYGPLTCSVITPSTAAAQCIVSSGSGHGFYWQVTVGGQYSATPFHASTTMYVAPLILTISAPTAAGLSTAGLETVTLTGVNFGPYAR